MSKKMTLKNGTQITVSGIPALLVLKVSERYPEPSVPVWRNEEKGGREEPNPLDPTYIQAVKDHATLIQDKTIDCYLANGVVVDSIGPDCMALDNDTWLENIEFTLGIDIPKQGAGRRVAWLRYHVLDEADELGEIINAISVASGLVTEEAVQQAAKTFRDNEDGDTDTPVQATAGALRDISDYTARPS